MKKHWVMDYETLYDCFTGVFENYKTSETKSFVVCSIQNDYVEFIKFLHQNINKQRVAYILQWISI